MLTLEYTVGSNPRKLAMLAEPTTHYIPTNSHNQKKKKKTITEKSLFCEIEIVMICTLSYIIKVCSMLRKTQKNEAI